jgi:hypothetical protein
MLRERLAAAESAKSAQAAATTPAIESGAVADRATVQQLARDLKAAGITPKVAMGYDAALWEKLGVHPQQATQVLQK